MKKMMIVAAVAIAGLTATFAQDVKQTQSEVKQSNKSLRGIKRASPEKIAEVKTQRLDEAVTLTAEQKKQINDIYLKQAQTQQTRAALNAETEAQVKSVLSPEQAKKYEVAKAEQKEKLMERRAAMRGEQKQAPANQKMEK